MSHFGAALCICVDDHRRLHIFLFSREIFISGGATGMLSNNWEFDVALLRRIRSLACGHHVH